METVYKRLNRQRTRHRVTENHCRLHYICKPPSL